ncbi:MAG: hypothetical protein HY328_19645 [Chloroflexi bacterium]|nr:hypothetical protein [Chloroflexota bacterium]
MQESRRTDELAAMSLDELIAFFESEDLGDLWDELPEAHFDLQPAGGKRLLAVNETLAKELVDIAQSRKVSTESLVETFLWEKVREAA